MTLSLVVGAVAALLGTGSMTAEPEAAIEQLTRMEHDWLAVATQSSVMGRQGSPQLMRDAP
jgi:hypothetical protein